MQVYLLVCICRYGSGFNLQVKLGQQGATPSSNNDQQETSLSASDSEPVPVLTTTQLESQLSLEQYVYTSK